ncbi:MAG: hypothetical protein ACQESR_24435 [Planctomycetota bacterium]
MAHRVLEKLKTDEFALKFSFISNVNAIHRSLQRSEDVNNVRLALETGEISEEALRAFSSSLFRELEPGQRHHHELALAAVVVVLERRPTSFAEEYILDLARLDLAELPIAIRVARKASQERLKMPANRSKVFSLDRDVRLSDDWRPACRSREVVVGQSEYQFDLEKS